MRGTRYEEENLSPANRDPYLRLAAAIMQKAWIDLISDNKKLAKDAYDWFMTDGPLYADALELGDVISKVQETWDKKWNGKLCSVPGCFQDANPRSGKDRGLCSGHYSRFRRYGNVRAEKPLRIRKSGRGRKNGKQTIRTF